MWRGDEDVIHEIKHNRVVWSGHVEYSFGNFPKDIYSHHHTIKALNGNDGYVKMLRINGELQSVEDVKAFKIEKLWFDYETLCGVIKWRDDEAGEFAKFMVLNDLCMAKIRKEYGNRTKATASKITLGMTDAKYYKFLVK